MERQFDGVADMPDLHGKVVVVTGPKVYFTTQSSSKAEATKKTLVHDPSITPDNVDWLVMDPMDPTTVSHAIHILKTKERKVDILTFHHMGPFLLVDCMLPLLKNTTKDEEADVRVISLSSAAQTAMLPNNFNFQFSSISGPTEPVAQWPWLWRHVGRFLFGFDMIRYAVSKAAVVLFIKELQRRLEEQSLHILCMAVHPGEVATESLLELNSFPLKTIARMSFLTAEQGALPPLFAATAGEVRKKAAKYKGQFLMPIGKVGTPNAIANDDRQINKQLAARGLPVLQAW
ncbi:hypothetical protein EDB80DRAFT_752166 [Ilyonectria destructans]|nr:hypothetical protein EDB80DRAFT_752166 [Ilyonectria destructans]